MSKKHSFIYRNSLSIVLIALMFLFWGFQFITGITVANEERKEKGITILSTMDYAKSGHFIQATFENWESEFLQMAFYVFLTVYLRQKGSSESKSLDKKAAVDREPSLRPNAPWPVRKGGLWLKLYCHSLSIAFFCLFLVSFVLHFFGSLKLYNEHQLAKNMSFVSAIQYMDNSQFWFESFQNWQSEFLAVAAIVLLSIWLREKGSPESKPVDAAYDEDAE
ncbi:MAG: hypothetical protein M3Q56_09830 [Bacteroidota bacterium]|nr:hypothetical protein [Bacteroidota bacterium]